MTVIQARTFCCCIPVRLGVFIIGLLGLFGGGALAVTGALQAHRIEGSKISIAIIITVYALLAIVSALGLVGAVARRVSLIKMYFGMLVGHLVFSLTAGIYAIYRVFEDTPDYIQRCLETSEPADDLQQVCTDGTKILKGATISVLLIFWLFEIWGCVIVSNYAKQLEDELAVGHVVKDTEAW